MKNLSLRLYLSLLSVFCVFSCEKSNYTALEPNEVISEKQIDVSSLSQEETVEVMAGLIISIKDNFSLNKMGS